MPKCRPKSMQLCGAAALAVRVERVAEVGGAVERQRGGHAAQRRRARLGQKVGLGRAEAEMHVRIDDAGHDPSAVAVDTSRRRQVGVGRQQRAMRPSLTPIEPGIVPRLGQQEQAVAQEKIELHGAWCDVAHGAGMIDGLQATEGSMPPSAISPRSAAVCTSELRRNERRIRRVTRSLRPVRLTRCDARLRR